MAIRELKKIDIASCAMVLGLTNALIGLAIAVLTAIIGASRPILGVLTRATIVAYPVLFFIAGFIGGGAFAVAYNFVAKKYKGILIELK